jgi:hypothetical protein
MTSFAAFAHVLEESRLRQREERGLYATAPHGRSVSALLPQLHLDRGELVVAAGHGSVHGMLLFRREIRHRAAPLLAYG